MIPLLDWDLLDVTGQKQQCGLVVFFFPLPFKRYSLHYGSRIVLNSVLRSLVGGVKDLVFRKDSSSKDLSICNGFIAVHVALNYCSVLFFEKAVNIRRWAKIRYSIV